MNFSDDYEERFSTKKGTVFIGNKNVVNGMVGQAIARLSIRHQLV